MTASHVLIPRDDGQLWVAELLDQHRDRRDGTWQVVVRYTTEPGFTYVRAMPADCRRYPSNRMINRATQLSELTSPTVKTMRPGLFVAWGRHEPRR